MLIFNLILSMTRSTIVRSSILLGCLTLFVHCSIAQGFPTKALKKKHKFQEIQMDEGNGDGVFMAKSTKTKQWGMYQYMYDGLNVKTLVPPNYDKLNYFPFNSPFTAVFNEGKVGFYLSNWSYGSQASESVACKYDDYQRFTSDDGTIRLAVKQGDHWGWVNWLNGKEMSEFTYPTSRDLPYPTWKQSSFFE